MASLAIMPVACGEEKTGVVRGVVTGVEAMSLLELRSLDVEDEDGDTWHFEARGFKGYTPSHLREHMVQGLRVAVVYHKEKGAMVIDEITD